jgi:hypothetical protein
MLALLLALQTLTAAPTADPFAFVQPSVTLTADDRRQLDSGEPMARIVAGQDREVAVFAAVPVRVDGDRLVAWMRRIEALKKSSYVVAIARCSDPPRMEDLAELSLDDEDLSEILVCLPGSCALKLSANEMTELQHAAAGAHGDRKATVQQAFRQVVLLRAQMYLADGHVAQALPDALVVSREIFSTHYIDASLGVTAIIRGLRADWKAASHRTELLGA